MSDPAPVLHRAVRAPHHHHPIHVVVGRRLSPAHAARRIADACPKMRTTLWLPRRVTAVALHLADPPLLTVLGITVVGISAFPGATVIQSMTGPVAGGGVSTPPAGGGGSGTSVPEPGTAAILAVAMVVVLVSSWIHGARAFRTRPESKIVVAPLKVRDRKQGVPFEKRTKNFCDLALSSRERRA